MNKLLIKLTACAFGLALSSTAVIAADPKYPEKGGFSRGREVGHTGSPDR